MNWESWDDRKLEEDGRLKLLFIKRFGEKDSEFMEKGVFGRKGVETLTNMYMPVMSDADERPDIYLKYSIGSTPTVVILSRDGKTLAGGGLCDYETFIKFMIELGTIINREREIIENYGKEDIPEDIEYNLPEENIKKFELVVSKIAEKILETKIKSLPIFINLIEFSLLRKDERMGRSVLNVIKDIEDKVEGGFFVGSFPSDHTRFYTRKDARLNLKLTAVLKNFAKEFKDDDVMKKAERTFDFFKKNFLGEYVFSSLAEDEEYYKSTESIRQIREKPHADERLFFDVNMECAQYLAEIGEIELAEKIIEETSKKLIDEKCVYHSEKKDVSNLLCDISQALLTFSVMFKKTGDKKWKDKFDKLTNFLEGKKGNLLFFEFKQDGFGFLRKKKVDPLSNLKIAKALMNMGEVERASKMKGELIPFVEKNPLLMLTWNNIQVEK